jgi:hypothetical protein
MAEVGASPEPELTAPPVMRDYRLLIRFVASEAVVVALLWGIGLAAAWGWVPGPLQNPVVFGSVLAALALQIFVFAPLWLGIRCKRCGQRIFAAPARPGHGRAKPLRFYCPACEVDWDTGIRGNAGE